MCFSDLSGCSLIGLASSLAIAISENASTNEVASLSAFFSALGDNLAIISTQRTIQEENNENNNNNNSNKLQDNGFY